MFVLSVLKILISQPNLCKLEFRKYCIMAEISPEQLRFEEVLHFSGLELKSFYTNVPSNLLPNATTYPEFFNHNLQSPNRVIKCLANDPHSNLRVFYFNLFRLSYCIIGQNDQNSTALLNLRNYVLHPQFQILFTSDTQPQRELYNDHQFKKLFAEFLNLLDIQQSPDIEYVLNSFPIIDTVMIHLLRSVLAKEGHDYDFSAKIPTDLVFVQLCDLFGLNLTAYISCWKFEDSDLFCLQYTEDELYMAYIEDSAPEVQLPREENKSFDNSVTLNIQICIRDQNEHSNRTPEVATNSTPGSSASYYIGQQIRMHPAVIGVTGSQPLISNPSNPILPNPYFISSKEIPSNSSNQEKLIQSNGLTADSPSRSDNYSLLVPCAKISDSVHNSGNSIQGQMTPKSSVISHVSDIYEFVDFTNSRTLYNDKLPKDKFLNVPSNEEIRYSDKQFGEMQKDSFQQHNKAQRVSPVYQGLSNYSSVSRNFEYSGFESPKYQKIQNCSPKQLGSTVYQTPQSEYPFYQSPLQCDFSKSKLPHFQPQKFEITQTKADTPRLDIFTKDINYEPIYKPPLSDIPSVLSSMRSTQSAAYTSQNNQIQKLNQRDKEFGNKGLLNSVHMSPQVFSVPMTTSINPNNVSGDLGDFYRDFTSSFLLQKLQEPFKTGIRAIKNRIRGLKRTAVTPSTFVVNQPSVQRSSFSRPMY